ncbi:hypothetical protein [Halonotius pteroides]|uniref:hypothetical protein n=1 Tax=Halonotius pteroides TaxID=268735 RepID=UPI001058E35B|nr:hypothetical protein [Halonotius pteroides]
MVWSAGGRARISGECPDPRATWSPGVGSRPVGAALCRCEPPSPGVAAVLGRFAGDYTGDDLLLLIDSENVAVSHRAELVTAAAQDTSSIHHGGLATVEIAGNGYQVQLPGCQDAGFRLGDTTPVSVGDGVLVIHDGEESRLAGDLLTLRDEQVSS